MGIHTLNQVVSSFTSLVLVIDGDGRFSESFNSGANMLLMPEADFDGRHFSEVLPADIAELLDRNMRVLTGSMEDAVTFEYSAEIDSRTCWFSCSLRKMENNPEYPVGGFIANITNISTVKEQQQKVHHREQLLIASALANEQLLENRNFVKATSIGLRELGMAMNVERCYMFESVFNEELGENVLNQLFEWSSDSAEPQIDNPDLQNIPHSEAMLFIEPFLQHKPLHCIVSGLPEGNVRSVLEMQEIKSLLAIPIYVNNSFWGFVGFDDCLRERSWTNAEVSILSSFATSISSSIIRRGFEDDLINAKNIAEYANKAKSQFLSNITHEIRTPLHGVIGNTEMLAGLELPYPKNIYFDNLRMSANLLFELMSNILDFSRIEADVFEYNPESCSLSEIISDARASTSYFFGASRNLLEISIQENLEDIIYVDPIRMKQILVNLLSNAAKFSDHDQVVLSVYKEHNKLFFSVKDNGIGMTEDQIGMIFKPFKQFDSSYSKKYQGTGLGLSIANHIIQMMGSKLEIESSPGKGSLFYFALEFAKISCGEDVKSVPKSMETPVFDLAIDIMVVEDNHINMTLAEHMLTELFPLSKVIKASNGLDALRILERGQLPDVILMDLQMPMLDGFETTRRIRSEFSQTIPIVALTASAISQIRDRCLEVGMNDFLSKPFSRENIADLLSGLPGSAVAS